MKHIGDVVCAIIEQDQQILIAQRPQGHRLENKWEFPGGKVNPGESLESAILREIKEEIDVYIKIDDRLTPNEHSYEHISLTLIPFICTLVKGTPQTTEHQKIAWVDTHTVDQYDFAEADIPILIEYLEKRRAS